MDDAKKLELLTSIVVAEQSNYWMRFTSFSAITTGLVVLSVSLKGQSLVALFGLGFSTLWLVIQWLSYHYVVFYDRIWEPLIEDVGFRTIDKAFWGAFPRATFFGLLTAGLSVAFWAIFLIRPDLSTPV